MAALNATAVKAVSELWHKNRTCRVAVRFAYNHHNRSTEMTVAHLLQNGKALVRTHRPIRRSTAVDMAQHLQQAGWDLCSPCW